jgi:hypothetical protein
MMAAVTSSVLALPPTSRVRTPLPEVTSMACWTALASWTPIRGRGVTDEEMRLGLAHPHRAPFVAFGAGVMGLPPDGWDGHYLGSDASAHTSD